MLLCSDNENLAESAKSYAALFFDVLGFQTYARQEKSLGDDIEQCLRNGDVDFLFSFLCPVILKRDILEAVRLAPINFHPAPPAYPGVGSASYAIYNGDPCFGVTAHVMEARPDSGMIIGTESFPIFSEDTCESLFGRAMNYALYQFYGVLEEIARTGELRDTGQEWERKAITRREFEQWMTLSPDAPPDEIRRKVKALRHSRSPGPFIEINGETVDLIRTLESKDATSQLENLPQFLRELTGNRGAKVKECIH